MRRSKSPFLLLLVAACTLVVSPVVAGDLQHASSFEQAQELAERHEQPILIKVGTSWCTSCKAFDEATVSNEAVQHAIAGKAVLLAIDAEKGEGVQLARAYQVQSYPTFVLTNAGGEVLDRWSGFWGADYFVKSMTAAVENPMTVADRLARFQSKPNETDARKLAELRSSEGMHAEAAAYYRRAQALNPSAEENYDTYVLKAMTRGAYNHVFTMADLQAQADVVLASSGRTDMDVIHVATLMSKVSSKLGQPEAKLPYLRAAIEQTSDASGSKVAAIRAKLQPDYTLHVRGDVVAAVEQKKAAMPAVWMDDANQLNNFAWWCFENEINLAEAERLGRRGVDLAQSGTEKANVLDTVAEICNLKGDCADSVELIRMAIAEDPSNDYFKGQLDRFEALLAAAR